MGRIARKSRYTKNRLPKAQFFVPHFADRHRLLFIFVSLRSWPRNLTSRRSKEVSKRVTSSSDFPHLSKAYRLVPPGANLARLSTQATSHLLATNFPFSKPCPQHILLFQTTNMTRKHARRKEYNFSIPVVIIEVKE